MADDLTLIVGQTKVSGWQSVRVTRGIERVPSDFDLVLTERSPGEVDAVVVRPGDACQVLLGDDLVVSGYVDRFSPSIAPGSHVLRVSGRGKCQDLVDCSAEWPGGQVANSNALQIAQKLASVYDLKAGGLAGQVIPQFNIMWGETAFDIIERVCRYSQLLVYDQPDGNLLLTQVGTEKAASGVAEGENVEIATAQFGMDQRFSDYQVRILSMSALSDIGNGSDIIAKLQDPNVPRHRLRYIVVESGDYADFHVSKARGQWEAARRAGRSEQVTATVDSWRDTGGKLWTPNTLVPVNIPTLKLVRKEWVLAEVTYTKDAQGTHAQLVLMPPEAFKPQPIVLQYQFRDVDAALNGAGR